MTIGFRREPRRRRNAFTLIEILVVLAIIGIISAIAIPSYLGQRRRARVIGDAGANCRAIALAMESYKSDNGNYGQDGWTITWNFQSTQPHYAPAPTLAGFTVNPLGGYAPSGNSGISFQLQVGLNGLQYTLDATDPSINTSPPGPDAGRPAYPAHCVYRIDETGRVSFKAN